jgi:hypothetical protein
MEKNWRDDFVKMRCPNRELGELRAQLRLISASVKLRSSLHFPCDYAPSVAHAVGTEPVSQHQYEERIAGRTYLIEVSPVSQSRWRAQIARLPGMPTALMPFYGQTPEQAAGELREWLLLLYKGTGLQ